MIPPGVIVGRQLPAPVPVPVLAGTVTPVASRSGHHIAGDVQGARLAYSDLNACAWFTGNSGRDLRGPRTMSGRRGMRGIEDNDKRKR